MSSKIPKESLESLQYTMKPLNYGTLKGQFEAQLLKAQLSDYATFDVSNTTSSMMAVAQAGNFVVKDYPETPQPAPSMSDITVYMAGKLNDYKKAGVSYHYSTSSGGSVWANAVTTTATTTWLETGKNYKSYGTGIKEVAKAFDTLGGSWPAKPKSTMAVEEEPLDTIISFR